MLRRLPLAVLACLALAGAATAAKTPRPVGLSDPVLPQLGPFYAHRVIELAGRRFYCAVWPTRRGFVEHCVAMPAAAPKPKPQPQPTGPSA